MPRMGIAGIGIIDAELHAILGDRDGQLARHLDGLASVQFDLAL